MYLPNTGTPTTLSLTIACSICWKPVTASPSADDTGVRSMGSDLRLVYRYLFALSLSLSLSFSLSFFSLSLSLYTVFSETR